MGCTPEQGDDCDCEAHEKPVHEVELDNFQLGQYEVTQEQWEAVMGETPSFFDDCPLCPVERVGWHDVQEFISKLNEYTGKSYRLPTEAEWEYAARGGEDYKFAGSDTLFKVAWHDLYGNQTHPVGTKQPNGYGLYDMSGNVWEWCHDKYAKDYYAISPRNNPKGPAYGDEFVLRGGSFADDSIKCRVAFRTHANAQGISRTQGFRLAH